mmetsp:Transcript_6468/g.28170  ORF Transcript_6468/g.28170 Transcript_6468/m.28170 type:complete len:227 (+) Transcript_6468:680-1360(+)
MAALDGRLRHRVAPQLEDAPPAPPRPAVLEPLEDDIALPRGRHHRTDHAEQHAEELEGAVLPSGRHPLRAQRHREEEGEDRDARLQRAGHHRGGEAQALEEQELIDEDPGEREHGERAPRRRAHHDGLPSTARRRTSSSPRSRSRNPLVVTLSLDAAYASAHELKRKQRHDRDDVPVRAEHVPVHPLLERNLGHHMVPAVRQLHRDQGAHVHGRDFRVDRHVLAAR